MDINEIMDQMAALAIEWGPKVIGAILVLIIGLWVIKAMTNGLSKALDKRDYDPSLKSFLKSILNILLKAMLVISVFGMIGIEMTSFVAILGAAGLAVGLALSGTLQNFAGGVMILILNLLQLVIGLTLKAILEALRRYTLLTLCLKLETIKPSLFQTVGCSMALLPIIVQNQKEE